MSALRTSTALKWRMWSLPCCNKSLCTQDTAPRLEVADNQMSLKFSQRAGYLRHLFGGIFLCVVVYLGFFASSPSLDCFVLSCFSLNREQQQQGQQGSKDAAVGSCPITPVKQQGRCHPHTPATSGGSGRHRALSSHCLRNSTSKENTQTSEKVHEQKQFNIQIKEHLTISAGVPLKHQINGIYCS